MNFAAGALACLGGGSVPTIVGALLSGTLLCGLINTWHHVGGPDGVRVRLRDIRGAAVRHLLAGSAAYMALQIIFLVTYAVDTLIVARHLGAVDASSYAIAERVFSMVAVAVSVVTAPLWAAYGEAIGRNDMVWVRQSFKSSLWRFALMAGGMCGALVALHGPLFRLLGAGEVSVALSLVLAMAVWRVVESLGSALAVFLYASESTRLVVFWGALTAAVSLTAKVTLVDRFGATALPLITLCTFVPLCMLPCALHIRRQFFSIPKAA
jgi:O-antigen/teichoic acid export membrane protein